MGSREVRLYAKQQIVSESRPALMFVVCVSHLTVRLAVFVPRPVSYGAVDVVKQDVARSCGTVVIKIIISVHAVLRLIILYDSVYDGFLLVLCQVKGLLPYPCAPCGVIYPESLEILDIH